MQTAQYCYIWEEIIHNTINQPYRHRFTNRVKDYPHWNVIMHCIYSWCQFCLFYMPRASDSFLLLASWHLLESGFRVLLPSSIKCCIHRGQCCFCARRKQWYTIQKCIDWMQMKCKKERVRMRRCKAALAPQKIPNVWPHWWNLHVTASKGSVKEQIPAHNLVIDSSTVNSNFRGALHGTSYTSDDLLVFTFGSDLFLCCTNYSGHLDLCSSSWSSWLSVTFREATFLSYLHCNHYFLVDK